MKSPQALPRSAGARTTLRVVGIVLLLGGLVVGGLGLRDFVADAESMDMGGGFGPILRTGLGGFMCVFGFGAISAGTLGAQSRYVAGETMPTFKQSAAYLSDGEGIMGIGRSNDDGPASASTAAIGPFCRSCGVRNDERARFCDNCGTPLA